MRVAVIYGGRSGEHEVSLRSAEAIINALDPEKYKVIHYRIDKSGKWNPKPIQPEPGGNPEIDVVFPVLHGTFGEDGTVQGVLEMADLPYVGPGVLASAACMDKDCMKRILRDAGVPVVEYVTVTRGAANAAELGGRFGFPVFVKPANLGSSVGISKVKSSEELRDAIQLASQYDHKVIVERAIAGQELECSVMGNQSPVAATPCEILPSREFYDYEDKYLLDKAETKIPADISREEIGEVKRIAIEAYRAMGCEGMARVDFLLEHSSGQLYVNELNTIPGFTSISMFPKMFEHDGVSFRTLVEKLIELALERHRRKQATRFER
ncbi:MAG: D-alanine--D-alanine ligase [Bryobacteraceae bacterium]|nr:D-alanine--D-alanine ligase [Bryobacteraceae bacterium]